METDAQFPNSASERINGKSIFWQTIVLIILVLGVVGGSAYFISQRLRADEDLKNQKDFDHGREVVIGQISDDLAAAQDVLYAFKGLFSHSGSVSRTEFESFADAMNLGVRNTSLFSVRHLVAVKRDKLGAFLSETRKEYPGVSVFPETNSAELYIVRQDRVVRGDSPSLVGFDASSDPVRKEAFDRARDSGSAALSGPFFSKEIGASTFLIALPLYVPGVRLDTIEQRRAAISGFVVALYIKEIFFENIFNRINVPGLDVETFDGRILSPATLYFDNDNSSLGALANVRTGSSMSNTQVMDFLGRTWTIFFSYHPTQALFFGQFLFPEIVLYGGLAFAFLLVIIIILLTTSRSRAVGIAERMTLDLARFRLAVESSANHIVVTDPDGKIFFANPAVTRITGYSHDELIGQTPRLWGKQMDLAFYKNLWHQIKDLKIPFDATITNKRKNGQLYQAHVLISPILDEKKKLVGFVGQEEDVTEKVRSELQLAEEKARAEAILRSIGDGVAVVDSEGKILLVNETAKRMLGYGDEEIVGKRYVDLWRIKDNEGKDVLDRPLDRSLKTGVALSSSDFSYTRKDGSLFPVFIAVAPVKENDKIIGAVDVFHDISVEKSIDRAKTEFVSLASHQLRTPLSAVNWYTEMLLNGDLGAIDPNQRKYIEEIAGSNRRMVDLVNALLNVSRIDLGTFSIEPVQVDVVALAKNVISELQPQIVFKKQQFSENFEVGLPKLSADENLMRMIFTNLFTNAVKYTADNGKVELAIKTVKAGTVEYGRVMTTDGMLFRVTDNGYGIPENQKNRIFQKLFRADNVKERDTEGTGLGLYIVKSIVDAAGGLVWFDSVENQGSSFYVVLPLTGMPKRMGEKRLNEASLSGIF